LKNYFTEVKDIQLEEILTLPLQMKESGKYFEKHVTSYPFDKATALDELKLLANTFGRILVYENFFFWFSGSITIYNNTFQTLMEGEGIIPIDMRYYIGIMAVSTIRSYYLFKQLQEIFLIKGGDEDWLIYGLNSAPEKLKKLSKINNILAHQPWKLTTNDINELLTNKNGWNRDEFLHAALILINFHRLAAIVESLKFNLVDEIRDSVNISLSKIDSSIISEEEKSITSTIFDEMKNMNYDTEGKTKLYNNLMEMNESNDENGKKNPRKFSGDDVKIVYEKDIEKDYLFRNFISNYCTLYLDFDSFSDSLLSNLVLITIYN
jgi:hypothetical protein